MEFRIAPMILIVLSFIFISFSNPILNSWISPKQLASYTQILIPYSLILVLALSTYFRHTYYSKGFKFLYWLFFVSSIAMMVFYMYAVEQQHFV